MSSKGKSPRHPVACVAEAEEAVNKLRVALKRSGITLPSLRIDPASYARDVPCPLVELGRCDVETVRLVTAALAGERGDAP
ncbi:hypothetical protein [Streptomyces sp. NPDC003023]|uniref:hypothetical protein n=1 Tax=Streptomyces sp. NPDC003023 TaxID=3364675 RepID=UPI0036CD417C